MLNHINWDGYSKRDNLCKVNYHFWTNSNVATYKSVQRNVWPY